MRMQATAWSLALLFLAGCSVGPEYTPPTPKAPAEFSARSEIEAAEAVGEALLAETTDPAETRLVETLYEAGEPEADWWRLLGDDDLDRLVEAALQANHDLRIAEANLVRARALLGVGRRDRYPTVTSTGSVSRERASLSVTDDDSRDSTVYSGELAVAWELDLFGRVRRSIEALEAEEGVAVAELRAVAVAMTADVALTYLELRGEQDRLAVARENAKNQRETYELTQALLEGGRGTDLDLARAEAQLEQTLASLAPLEANIAASMHRLAVLTGRTPGELVAELTAPSGGSEAARMPALPSTLPIGEPVDLLRRRPDIRAAERRLAAQTARIGVLVGDLFPRVRLLGGLGFLSTSASDIADSGSTTYSIGPFLSWPAFDLGRVRQRIAAAEADGDAALAAYEQTVLIALEETENALVDYARSRERQARLAVAADASQRAAELANVRYRYGADSFLTVLDAERRLLEAQDLHAQSNTRAAAAFVQLYRALGGAWAVQP
ncbi:MAG: efflux transporter outer membrane subunit [Acidobacteriota bacterium]